MICAGDGWDFPMPSPIILTIIPTMLLCMEA